MYKNILLAYDGSTFSNKALQEAIRITKSSGGSLLILSVVDITDEFESEAPGLTDKLTDKLLKLTAESSGKSCCRKSKGQSRSPCWRCL